MKYNAVLKNDKDIYIMKNLFSVMSDREPTNIEWAKDRFPNSCSCGIDYKSQGMTYKQHLEKSHVVEVRPTTK